MSIRILSLIIFLKLSNLGISQTVTIGNQVWCSKNLEVSVFRNGDTIPEVKSAKDWKIAGKNKQPAWCYYNNQPENGEKYGKLYNWYAISDSRGIAPMGWHVPSDIEWVTLINFLGGENTAGEKMKSKEGWVNNKCSNRSGFAGLPGGARSANGKFNFLYKLANFWSSTELIEQEASNFYLHDDMDSFDKTHDYKARGFSVRCIKD
jgi:uncharacterized protein (TIGR02145 family)